MRRLLVFIALLVTAGPAVADGLSLRLPRGRAAPKAVTGCEAFGPGFVKAEGSNTCIRVSGSVGVEFGFRTGGGASFDPGSNRR